MTTAYKMKSYDWLYDELKSEIDKWFVAQCRNNYAAFYLYFKPSYETFRGQLVISEEAPEGFELADPTRISGFKTKEQEYARLYDVVRRLPVLGI